MFPLDSCSKRFSLGDGEHFSMFGWPPRTYERLKQFSNVGE